MTSRLDIAKEESKQELLTEVEVKRKALAVERARRKQLGGKPQQRDTLRMTKVVSSAT